MENKTRSKILIVDDEPDNIRVLAKALTGNYKLIGATSGHEAISCIEAEDAPDLILLDIRMPGMDGYEVLRKIKSDKKTADIPIIFITAMDRDADEVRGLELGAADYIIKPFNPAIIDARVRTHLERRLAEESLKEAIREKDASQAKLEAVFRSIPEGIITVDAEGRVIQMNEPLENICPMVGGMKSGEFLEQLTDRCSAQCVRALLRLLETGKTVTEHPVECKENRGMEKRLSLTTSPLLDHQNQVMGGMLVIRDITRLVELETKLQERSSFKNIIGQSEPMQRLYNLLEQFANTDTTVLITGETGTGKERVMEAIHYSSPRSEKPLVKVNCAMLAENLIESELFGHVKGAFTSADRDKIGRFQTAQGGTLFLDEIGELAPHLQAKLLRVLEYKEFERVGESITRKADVRVIAATNVELAERVQQKKFREDFYYRLKVFSIQLPPLRERIGDIPLLLKHFLDIGAKNNGKEFTGVSDRVLSIFMRYPWPGNVRELKNAIEYASVICPGGAIRVNHLPPELVAQTQQSLLGKNGRSIPLSEKDAILDALNRTKWNKSKTARVLGVSRGTLYSRLRKYNISEA